MRWIGEDNRNKGDKYLLYIVGILLMVYVVYRADKLSFTHDESLSFTMLLGNDQWKYTANNHWLNTWLMKASASLFGKGELALRLPNILAFALYVNASIGLLLRGRSEIKWMLALGVALLFLNPFMIEFFSLARGYGLALGCMMVSLLHIQDIDNKGVKSYFWHTAMSLFFAVLSVLANMALMNFYICLVIVLAIKLIAGLKVVEVHRTRYLGVFLSLVAVSLYPMLYVVRRLLAMSDDELYYGVHSLWTTLNSLTFTSLYLPGEQGIFPQVLSFIVLILLVVGLLHIVVHKRWKGNLFTISLLIVGISVGWILENKLFGTLYPSERTALFYVPLLALYTYYLISELFGRWKFKMRQLAAGAVGIALPLILLIHFVAAMNLKRTRTWSYDADNKEAMAIVAQLVNKTPEERRRISNDWLLEPSINYYLQTRGMNVHPANRFGITDTSDYVLGLGSVKEMKGYSLRFRGEASRSYLLVRDK